jgi:hypothetical protein
MKLVLLIQDNYKHSETCTAAVVGIEGSSVKHAPNDRTHQQIFVLVPQQADVATVVQFCQTLPSSTYCLA